MAPAGRAVRPGAAPEHDERRRPAIAQAKAPRRACVGASLSASSPWTGVGIEGPDDGRQSFCVRMGDNHRTRGGPDRDVVPDRPCRTACTCYSSPRAHAHRLVLHARADRPRAAAGDRRAALRRQRRPAAARRLRELPGVAGRDRGRAANDPVRELHRRRRRASAASSSARSRRVRAPASQVRRGATTGWAAWSRSDIWHELRDGGRRGARVQSASPGSPFGWLSRDHRKTIAIDGARRLRHPACASARAGLGDARSALEPWRDTGVEMRGPAVAEIERAFAQVWAVCGDPARRSAADAARRASTRSGTVALRVVADVPSARRTCSASTTSIASMARQLPVAHRCVFRRGARPTCRRCARPPATASTCACWCRARATSRRCSRCRGRGYRPLLEAGVRVFEWNGTMLHAKTAVADGQWARVGSTNLNLASWHRQLRARRRDRGRPLRRRRWRTCTRTTCATRPRSC